MLLSDITTRICNKTKWRTRTAEKELWVLLASFVLPIALGTAFFYWNPTAFTGNTVAGFKKSPSG
jgi:hypothetical protein